LTQFGAVQVQLAFIVEKHIHASLLADRQQRGRLSLPPKFDTAIGALCHGDLPPVAAYGIHP
jgi:hypothetical protein